MPTADIIEEAIAVPDDEHERRWHELVSRLEQKFGRVPDVDAVLFLMGVQSVGRGFEPDIPKERKQSLIMEGSYLAFETLQVYRRMGLERNGFWIWERVFEVPKMDIDHQEKLLQVGILNYFEQLT